MITKEDFIDRGYKFYDHAGKGEYCIGLWQKCVRTSATNKKKYFINIYVWKFPYQRESFESETVFYLSEFESVTLSGEVLTLERTETLAERFYLNFDCIPDALNN